MEDEVAIFHRRLQYPLVQHVPFDQLERLEGRCPLEELALARGEIVENHHLVAVRQQTVRQVAADEARSSRDQVTASLKMQGRHQRPLCLAAHAP